MEMKPKAKYRLGKQYKSQKSTSAYSGVKGAKGLDHPIGFSGRTMGKLIQKFRPPNSKRGK